MKVIAHVGFWFCFVSAFCISEMLALSYSDDEGAVCHYWKRSNGPKHPVY